MTASPRQQTSILREIQTSARHMAAYGMGGVLVKALGFLMIRFYTHYFTPADYGILEILDLSMSLLGMILNMGLTQAFLRCYASAGSDVEKRRVVSTGALFVNGVGVGTFLLGALLVPRVSALLFGSHVPSSYLLVSFASFVVSYMASLPKTYLRALEASGIYTTVDTVGVLVQLVLNVVFIAGFKLGLVGVFWSSLLVGSLQFIGLSWWAYRKSGLHFDWKYLNGMLRFGMPLIFANSGLFILNFADRFFLQHFWSLDVVGIYALGYKFGYMLNYLLVQPFLVMWQARMFSIHAHPEHPRIFKDIFALYTLGLTYAGLAMSLFSAEMVAVMAEAKFAASKDVIPVVVLSYVVYGIAFYVQFGMMVTDNTKIIGIIGGATALINLGLNYFLVSQFGMMGAAFATLVSFAVLAAASYWQSQRVFPLPLGMGRVCTVIGLAIVMYLVCYLGSPAAFGLAVAMKVAALAVFPIVIWKSSILPAGAAETLTSAAGRAIGIVRHRGWISGRSVVDE